MKKKHITLLISLCALVGFSFSVKHTEEVSSIETINVATADSSYAEIYPTYFDNECFVKGFSDPNKEIRIEFFDINGLLVQTFVLEDALNSNERQLDLSSLNQEVMIVRVYEDQTLLKKARLIKK